MSLPHLRHHLLEVVRYTPPAILARGKTGLQNILAQKINETVEGHQVVGTIFGTVPYKVCLGEDWEQDSCECQYFVQNEATCKHMVSLCLYTLKELQARGVGSAEVPMPKPVSPTTQFLNRLETLAHSGGASHGASMREPLSYSFDVRLPFDRKNWSLVPSNGFVPTSFSRLRGQESSLFRSIDKLIMNQIPFTYRMQPLTPEQPMDLLLTLQLLKAAGTLLDGVGGDLVRIHTESVKPVLQVRELEDGGAEFVPILLGPDTVLEISPQARIFGHSEMALQQGRDLHVLDLAHIDAEQLTLLTQRFSLSAEEVEQNITRLLELPNFVKVPESWQPVLVPGSPVPVLDLVLDRQTTVLEVFIRFGYPPSEDFVPPSGNRDSFLAFTEEKKLCRILRDIPAELVALDELTVLMKKSVWRRSVLQGMLTIDRQDIPGFLDGVITPLREIGRWEVVGLEKLGAYQKRKARVQLGVSSGIDWFDLSGHLEFEGGQEISLLDLLKLPKDSEFVVLPDGSKGVIPQRIAQLLRIVQGFQEKESEYPLRISRMHQGIVQTLLDNGDVPAGEREGLRKKLEGNALRPIAVRPPPAKLQAKLRAYQEEGVHWLRQMKAWCTGGILADDMGLGKTVQVIAVLCDFYSKRSEQRPSMVVMPTSLIHNWKRELERFAPHLLVYVHHGWDRAPLDVSAISPRSIVLTSYALLRNEIEEWAKLELGYAILDESQAVKNPFSRSLGCARQLVAQHRLAMTGTPVENHLMDLWSQFSFVNPGLLGNRIFFEREFAKAGQEESSQALDMLTRMIAPFYLRRTKGKVLQDLPPLEERVLYVDMDSAQRNLYEKTKEKYRRDIIETIQNKGVRKAQIHIIEGMLRLRQIACDPRLYISGSKVPSAKLELLVEKLKEDVVENHKALVFSQFTTLLQLCGEALQREGIEYAYLDGSTRHREKAIAEFTQSSDKRVFLISLKAGGAGLNLACADYVFHLDPWWNPAVEAQATARAHRIGQTCAVQSIKLVAADTIEEKILQLQDSKRQLAAKVISSDKGLVQSLDLDLVKMLFD